MIHANYDIYISNTIYKTFFQSMILFLTTEYDDLWDHDD